jgi:hypothetical protein
MKIVIIMVFLILAALTVQAAEVCVVAQLSDTNVKGDCFDIDNGVNGFTVLETSDLDFTWSDPGVYGRALCKIEGKGDNVVGSDCAWGNEYWGFYLVSNNQWSYLPVGFDSPGDCWNYDMGSFGGHYCSRDGDVIGFRYGPFGTIPDMLNVKDIKINVDDDKSSADEDGGKIKDVKPQSEIEIIAKFENLYPEDIDVTIEEVYIEVIIEGIDDGSDITDESDSIDISANEAEEIVFSFDLPLEIKKGNFPFKLKIFGEDEKGIDYEREIEYKIYISKEKNELKIIEARLTDLDIDCKGSSDIEFEVVNIGTKDQDVVLTIENSDLGLKIEEKFTLDKDPFDSDSQYKGFYSFGVNEVAAGSYPIEISMAYSGQKLKETLNLDVEACEIVSETKPVVVQQTPPITAAAVVDPVAEKQPIDSSIFMLGVLFVLALVIVVVLLFIIFKK